MRQLHYLYTTNGFFSKQTVCFYSNYLRSHDYWPHFVFFDSFSRLHHCMLIASWPRLFPKIVRMSSSTMFVVSICIFWLLFVLHFFHFFIHIFRLSNCEDKAFYNWILSNNGSVHNFYLRKVFLKLWIDLSIIILFKAVKFQDDTPAQDIIFLTADWSNFDLLNTAIIPVKIFVFFFWTILWHLFDRCLI